MSAHPDTRTATPAKWIDLDTAGRVSAVRVMAAGGKTSSEMAAALGTSRSAVLGIAHRNKITVGGGQSRAVRMPQVAQPMFPAGPSVAPETWHPHRQPISMMALTDHTCRWPVGEAADSKQMFCGDHVHRRGYCTKHYGVAFAGVGREILPVEDRPYKESINRRDYRQLVFGVKAQRYGVEQ